MTRPRRDDHYYISMDQAMQLAGCCRNTLKYHVQAGNIRARKFSNGRPGRNALHLHVDDVAHYAYPALRDVAQASGAKRSTILWLIYSRQVPGLSKFGNEYRIRHDWFPRIVRWIRAGAPVRPPYLPKESL